jgi:carboxylate-amine ligase
MGEETGLKSYRTALTNEIPRSGLPGVFDGPDAYDAVVDALKRSGAIPDESYLWWAVRPSAKFPTLEMRMTDTCTDARDALAIAALYRALVHRLAATVGARGRERRGSRHQIVEEENRWQAARYGLSGRFIDDTGAAVGMATAIRALVDWVSPSSEALRLEHEIAHIPSMIERGTSADGQIAIYRAAISEGANASDALRQVARDLVTRTRRCE